MNSGKTAGGPLPPAGHKPQLLFVSRERNGGAPLLALFEKWAAAQPTPRAFLPYAGSAQGLAPFETWDAADAHLNSRSVIPVVILSGAKDLCILPRQNRECIQKQSRGCIQND